MNDNVKKALLDGTATIQTKIEILPTNENEEPIILTEEKGVVSWDYEDFRYVKDEGWIGQFVARQVNGVVKNISDDFSMTNKEFILHMGVKIGNNTSWFSLGNFLVNKVTDDEVNDKTSFEALDYTKKFNQTYVNSITYPCTALELAQNVCEQCGCELGNTDFKHNNWEITGNVFTNGESCREVLKAIGKLAYSWVRVDWDNKVYIDFTKETNVDIYNKITNHEYYSLTTQKEKFGAINRVVIGYKDIEGERTKVENKEDIKINGVNEITVYDNPLVYSQELREKAIVGAEDLFGLEYLPLETLTVGHPWLKGNELVEVTDMEGKVHKTIPFDRTIQYFGHIKTKINVATNTKTNTEYAYESGIGGRLRKTEIDVDKIKGQITEVIEEQNETTKKLNETISTVEETKQTISSVETTVEDITTTTQTSTGGNNLYLEDALESNALEYHVDGKSEQETRSGKNILPNTATTITTNGITFTVNSDKSIKISGTSTAKVTLMLNQIEKTLSSGNYTMSFSTTRIGGLTIGTQIDSTYYSTNTYKNISLSANATFKKWYIDIESGKTINTTVYPQFESGSSVTNYEPYGASPSPDYPSEIKSIPSIRNLFDYENENNYIEFVDASGTQHANIEKISNGIRVSLITDGTYRYGGYTLNDTKEMLGKTYTISCNAMASGSNNGAIRIFWRNNTTATLGSEIKQLPSTGGTFTIPDTIPANMTNVVILFYGNLSGTGVAGDYVDYTNIMIEESPIAHPYVPYGAWAKVKITGKNLFDSSNTADLITGYLGNGIPVTSHSSSKTLFIECKPNTTYTVSRTLIGGRFTICDSEDKPVIGTVTNYLAGGNWVTENYYTITTSSNANYLLVWYSNTGGTNLANNNGYTEEELRNSIMIEENLEPTEYEPYQEKEVLIDLNKPNLFTGENITSGKRLLNTGKYYTDPDYFVSDYIPINTNTLYKVNYEVNAYTRMCFYDENKSFLEYNQTTNIINTSRAVYVRIGGLLSEINNIVLHEGYSPYYEISSIGDTKNTLDIVNGQVVIDKKIDEVVLDGSETGWDMYAEGSDYFYYIPNINSVGNYSDALCSHFINSKKYPTQEGQFAIRNNGASLYFRTNISSVDEWKTWLQNNPVTVKYVLAEPKQIILPNVQIPLFEGVNHISLVDDLETTTSIKYYRNTPIAQDYVVQQQLDGTNSNLADATNKIDSANKNYTDLSTNLSNNYYNKGQIDNINSSTTERITKVEKSVESSITSTEAELMIKQAIDTGINRIETTTGYTFDKDGLHTKKSDDPRESLVDNTGIYVNNGSTNMLTANDQGVSATNLTANNFIILYPIRQQKTTSESDPTQEGLGFFYIGA